MVALFFILGLVGAFFAWKKLSKNYIEKGHNKYVSHGAGIIAGFAVWFFAMLIGVAIFEPNQNTASSAEITTEAEVNPSQQFEADRNALKTYLNAVNRETGYVDSIIQDLGRHLTNGDVYLASSSASKCIDAANVVQLDLSSKDQLKPIELNNEENTDKLEKAIQDLSLGYYIKKGYCETVQEFIDTQKPSLVVEAEEKSNNAQSTIIGAVGQIMAVASAYKLSFKDGEWKADETNGTK
ncbi:MAG: hypothetical protein PHV10_07885 [Sulfuricurvum sp.]|nr:hypothetical protein [Sulfuricurvum sp.]